MSIYRMGSGSSILRPFATVAALEAAKGVSPAVYWCVETLSFYYYLEAGSAYTRDGTTILNTVDGGDTRFVAIDLAYGHGSMSRTLEADNANGLVESVVRTRGAAGQDNDVLWQKSIYGYNDNATPQKVEYGRIQAYIQDASDGVENVTLSFQGMNNGTLTETMRMRFNYLYVTAVSQIADKQNYFNNLAVTQVGNLTSSPAVKAYGNNAGAHEALLYVHSDHASATGPLATYLQDGTGTLGQYTRGVTADGTPGVMKWTRSRGAAAGQDADNLTQFSFYGLNDAGTPETIEFARINTSIVDASDGTEGGGLSLQTMLGGALTEGFYCGSDGWGLKGATSKTLSTGWSVTNGTTDKALDCDANDDLATADVLGTLITELIAKGVISA